MLPFVEMPVKKKPFLKVKTHCKLYQIVDLNELLYQICQHKKELSLAMYRVLLNKLRFSGQLIKIRQLQESWPDFSFFVKYKENSKNLFSINSH